MSTHTKPSPQLSKQPTIKPTGMLKQQSDRNGCAEATLTYQMLLPLTLELGYA